MRSKSYSLLRHGGRHQGALASACLRLVPDELHGAVAVHDGVVPRVVEQLDRVPVSGGMEMRTPLPRGSPLFIFGIFGSLSDFFIFKTDIILFPV